MIAQLKTQRHGCVYHHRLTSGLTLKYSLPCINSIIHLFTMFASQNYVQIFWPNQTVYHKRILGQGCV